MVAVMLAQEPLLSYQYQLSVALPGPSYHCNTADLLSRLQLAQVISVQVGVGVVDRVKTIVATISTIIFFFRPKA